MTQMRFLKFAILDALVDADSEALVLADSEALVLAGF